MAEAKQPNKEAIAAPPVNPIPQLDAAKTQAAPNVENKGTYATEYFKKNNIPYCEKCGDAYHNNLDGSPVCAESRFDCPRIK